MPWSQSTSHTKILSSCMTDSSMHTKSLKFLTLLE